MASRPVLRWVLPGAVLAAVLVGGAIGTTLTASAQTSLPPRSPQQLLVDVQTAQLDAASGTVVERADLGLPTLPDGFGGGRGAGGSSDLNSLISGSHTLRVWYSGPDKARIALLGGMGESDVIRNGNDVWVWSSAENTAMHQVIKAGDAEKHAMPTPSGLPSSPQEAASDILKQLDPTTKISIDSTAVVAGRPVYQLALTPKDTRSLISKVTIAVDGERHVPLEVQVYAKGTSTSAFKVGFTSVSFARPEARLFTFTPPPGAKVTQGDLGSSAGKPDTARPNGKSAVVGTGWTTVYVTRIPQDASAATPDQQQSLGSIAGLLNNLPKVSGSWGSGRLIQGKLFSALLTDDGRVLVGAVTGQQLQTVAGMPAAALK